MLQTLKLHNLWIFSEKSIKYNNKYQHDRNFPFNPFPIEANNAISFLKKKLHNVVIKASMISSSSQKGIKLFYDTICSRFLFFPLILKIILLFPLSSAAPGIQQQKGSPEIRNVKINGALQMWNISRGARL